MMHTRVSATRPVPKQRFARFSTQDVEKPVTAPLPRPDPPSDEDLAPDSGVLWYSVVSKTNEQRRAFDELRARGYPVFLPMGVFPKKGGLPHEVEERPLFGRYMFVGVPEGKPFSPIGFAPGVAYVVRWGDNRPCEIRPSVLRALKRRVLADGGAANSSAKGRDAKPAWKVGGSVHVLSGPFRDFMGVLSGVRGEFLEIALSIFGRETPVRVRANEIRAA